MKIFIDILNAAIEFGAYRLTRFFDFWEALDEYKRRVAVGCAIAAVGVICVAAIAYALGKAAGEREALEEDF